MKELRICVLKGNSKNQLHLPCCFAQGRDTWNATGSLLVAEGGNSEIWSAQGRIRVPEISVIHDIVGVGPQGYTPRFAQPSKSEGTG